MNTDLIEGESKAGNNFYCGNYLNEVWEVYTTKEREGFKQSCNKNDYRRISSGHIIHFGDSQDIILFYCIVLLIFILFYFISFCFILFSFYFILFH